MQEDLEIIGQIETSQATVRIVCGFIETTAIKAMISFQTPAIDLTMQSENNIRLGV